MSPGRADDFFRKHGRSFVENYAGWPEQGAVSGSSWQPLEHAARTRRA